MVKRIEDYALIGDCESGALVGIDGSIDWLCWPRFDSGALFAALLGKPDNGFWAVAPTNAKTQTSRQYLNHSSILETEFKTGGGIVRLIDFMPFRSDASCHLVRIVRGCRGKVRMRSEYAVRFGYGSIVPWVTRRADDSIWAVAGPDMAILRTDVVMKPEGRMHRGEFIVEAEESVVFVLSYGPSYQKAPEAIDAEEALEATLAEWANWAKQAVRCGEYSDHVIRSLVTLKTLTYRPTGGIVAAPTTSLPETLGGPRNWDYRYCWLRDATFTLLAFMNSGFLQEADAWRQWLRRAVAGDPAQVQIMYGLLGERRLDEWEVPWLAGYEGAKPVRIGNAAASQLQLDIYGEVLDALFQGGMNGLSSDHAAWDVQCTMLEHLETVWHEPDEGIWEVRGGRRHFTHSKVMAWVAFDRAIKAVERLGFKGPARRWRKIRAQIHKDVCEKGYDIKLGSFVQSYGATELDASVLLIPLVGFLPPSDRRVRSTVEAIERYLVVDGLVRRYDPRRTKDGLKTREGAFLACSFWLADNFILLGRHEDAKRLFEHLLSLRNDVGLLAEEYDTSLGRMAGNFPQAFSHVALINTAHNLEKQEKPAEQRSGKQTQSSRSKRKAVR
jgi:GH15 family glucan-1,4-alpha-glucosidase